MINKRYARAIGVALVIILSQGGMLYVGPGAGLTAIGSALALIAGIFLTIAGFVWYPVKRLFRRRQVQEDSSGP